MTLCLERLLDDVARHALSAILWEMYLDVPLISEAVARRHGQSHRLHHPVIGNVVAHARPTSSKAFPVRALHEVVVAVHLMELLLQIYFNPEPFRNDFGDHFGIGAMMMAELTVPFAASRTAPSLIQETVRIGSPVGIERDDVAMKVTPSTSEDEPIFVRS